MATLTTITAGMTGTQFISAVNGNDSNINTELTRKGVRNALDHGIVADGLTDNSTAIQSIIDTINAEGGGTIYFPPGTYLMNEIVIPDKVCVIGDNFIRGTIFRPYNLTSNTPLITLNHDNPSVIQLGGIHNIYLFGGGNNGTGLYMNNHAGLCKINGLTISGFPLALHLKGALVGQFDHCIFVGATTTGVGVLAEADTSDNTYANVWTFKNCEFYSCFGWSVKWLGGQQAIFEGCTWEVNGTPDVADSGCVYHERGENIGGYWHGITLRNCYYEANRGTILHFKGYNNQTIKHTIDTTTFFNNNSSGGLTLKVESGDTNRINEVVLMNSALVQETASIELVGDNAKIVNINSYVEGTITGTGYYTVTPTLVQ